MNLIIDVGNSFVKTAVFQSGELLYQESMETENFPKNIENLFGNYPGMNKMIISRVSNVPLKFPKKVKSQLEMVELDSSTKLPFENLYATPQTLGNDRKGLVAAASKYFQYKNTLIIDAGTCLTFDFKNDQNQYLGGAISPGLKMRYKALHTFTANLPFLEPVKDNRLTGNTTKTSIHAGVIFGMVKEIEGIIKEYKALYQDLTIIFTGGDAHFLSMQLKNSIFANSNFLLEGLNYILEFNNNQ